MNKLLVIIALTGMLVGCGQENEKVTADWLQGDWICTLTDFGYNNRLNKYEEGRSEEMTMSFKNIDGQLFANDTAFDLEKKLTSEVYVTVSGDYEVTNNISAKKNNYDNFSFINELNVHDRTKDIKSKNKSEMICTRIK